MTGRFVKITVMALVMLLRVCGTGWAAEAWTTDPKTGCKIGLVFIIEGLTLISASWDGPMVEGKAEGKGLLMYSYSLKDGKEIKVQAEAEMNAGKLEGKGSVKWSSGDRYDGLYKAGLREGKGVFWYANGEVYEGDFARNVRNGYGVIKDASGKVLYEGEWKDDKVPASAIKTDKIIGIPWGASEDEAARILSQRSNTRCQAFVKNAAGKTKGCYSTFNTEGVFIQTAFYQGKMYYVWIFAFAAEDQVMEKFNSYKKGLEERYGAPRTERGKYLDAQVYWDLGGGYNAQLTIRKNTISPNSLWPESQNLFSRPFNVAILYYHSETLDTANKALGANSVKEF